MGWVVPLPAPGHPHVSGVTSASSRGSRPGSSTGCWGKSTYLPARPGSPLSYWDAGTSPAAWVVVEPGTAEPSGAPGHSCQTGLSVALLLEP